MNKEFAETIERIRQKNKKFSPDAYVFVSEAIDETAKKLGFYNASQHLSGKELVEGMADFALDRFGPMTFQVLKTWGLTKTQDFGDIVYSLIDEKILFKSESDSVEDFNNVYDFRQRFLSPWEA